MSSSSTEWQKTACILCECNCGLEVQLGGEGGRHLVKLRGDKAHPGSRGYACEKAHRLDHYQNGPDRLLTPQRRRPDGGFEAIDWDTAIAEVAARLAKLRDDHGGGSILYYGGGGQGNHLPGAYASATRRALGMRYRSNALAQEKTGEFWVSERMIGTYSRADFHRCDVALFIGKNPWFSHGLPEARTTLKRIARDPARKMIVIDPRRTRTAELADLHLQVQPGGDAWLMSALVAALVQGDALDRDFLAGAAGLNEVVAAFSSIPVAEYAAHAGVSEAEVREAARLIAGAERLATYEDLGVQMNRHSTLVSYLHYLVWLLTGHLGREGTRYVPTPLLAIADGKERKPTPVTGARVIGGLVPCNRIADEILTDHPARFRGMIVESANPAHSLADSARMREALSALDTLVVIDVAMTETARLADYVLPASTQFEKAEATFFNLEFPRNAFQLRRPLLAPPRVDGEGPLPEAEIHARLCEALGVLEGVPLASLRETAARSRDEFMMSFMQEVAFHPERGGYAPVILYRSLGPTLPEGAAEGAVLFGLAGRFALEHGESAARAGFTGTPAEAAGALFDAILDSPSGVVFAEDPWSVVRERVSDPIQLALPDLLEELKGLEGGPPAADDAFPLVLSAGERRAFTANTIFRGAAWRKKDPEGALRVHPDDARALGLDDGGQARVTTPAGSLTVRVELSEIMRPGHVSLPNGVGAPNELTASGDSDPFAGTPWHKRVPARVEPA